MAGDGLDGIGAKSDAHFLVTGELPSGVVSVEVVGRMVKRLVPTNEGASVDLKTMSLVAWIYEEGIDDYRNDRRHCSLVT